MSPLPGSAGEKHISTVCDYTVFSTFNLVCAHFIFVGCETLVSGVLRNAWRKDGYYPWRKQYLLSRSCLPLPFFWGLPVKRDPMPCLKSKVWENRLQKAQRDVQRGRIFKKVKSIFEEITVQILYIVKPSGAYIFCKFLRPIVKQHLKPLSGVGIWAECYFRKCLYFSQTDNLTSTPTQWSHLFFTMLLPSLFMFLIKCNSTSTFMETLSKSVHQLYKSCLAPFFTPPLSMAIWNKCECHCTNQLVWSTLKPLATQ